MKDYFSILELSDNASMDDIKTAYRKLAKRYHPDVNKSPDAHEKFCEITEAYEFLIHHWIKFSDKRSDKIKYEQYYQQQHQSADYERFRREAQEKARRQARMRYEKFKKQHEAFQESGLNDIALIFTMLMRFISAVLFFALFFTPIVFAVKAHWTWIFLILFMWPFAIGLAWNYYDHRTNYFYPWKLYYNFNRIKHLFTDKKVSSEQCYYCRRKTADSRSYVLDLFKIKDIKLRTGGFRQHNVNYVNDSVRVVIPRSSKAFIIHSLSIIVKSCCLLYFLIFMNTISFPWRFIFGLLAGGLLTRVMLTLTRTKSNITYLYSPDFFIRSALWITAIIFASQFTFRPFNIVSNDAIHFVIVAIVIFDSFIMQLLSAVIGKKSAFPLFKQHPDATARFIEGFRVYNDIPIISIFYPLYRWIFG